MRPKNDIASAGHEQLTRKLMKGSRVMRWKKLSEIDRYNRTCFGLFRDILLLFY